MLQPCENTFYCSMRQNMSLKCCSMVRKHVSVLLNKTCPCENTCFMFLLYLSKISLISCICTFCWTITVSILYCCMYNEITKFCSRTQNALRCELHHREDTYLCLMGQKIILLQFTKFKYPWLNTTEMIKSKHPSDVTIRRMNDRIAIYEKTKENNVILHTTCTY